MIDAISRILDGSGSIIHINTSYIMSNQSSDDVTPRDVADKVLKVITSFIPSHAAR